MAADYELTTFVHKTTIMSIFILLLQKTSSVKNLWILFITSHLILLSMILFTFPIINNQIGTEAFDLQPLGYSIELAKSIVNNLNESSTHIYLFPQLTFLDLLYPALLALFLSSLIFRLLKSVGTMGKILLLVPFIAMTFDYFENICVVLMITHTIEISEWLVLTSSTFTILKGVLTTVAWITILVLSIKWILYRVKLNKTTSKKLSINEPREL